MLYFAYSIINAQCPSTNSITATSTSISNTCGGNGKITTTFTSTPNLSLQLIKGGTILNQVTNATSPYTWSNLQPGNDYQVKVICSIDNSIVYATNNVIVTDNYIPISNSNITINGICNTFNTGGTITVNSVTGGTAPYSYSIILSNDPAYPDTLSSYSASNTKNVTAFGTYQIRIKDACGNFKTFTRTLTSSLDPVEYYFTGKKSCGSNNLIGNTWWAVSTKTGSIVDMQDYINNGGLKIEMYEQNPDGTCSPKQNSAPLYVGIYTGSDFTYPMSPSHKYYIKTTSPCGEVATYCWDRTFSEVEDFTVISNSSGCGVNEKMTISGNANNAWVFPVNIEVTNNSSVVVYTNSLPDAWTTWTSGLLPFGNYTVKYTDTCSPAKSITKTITNPQTSGPVTPIVQDYLYWRCGDLPVQNQTGTVQVVIRVDGYLQDRANAIIKIVSGPSNVGVIANVVDGIYWGWSNMLPGNYTISITSCGVTNNYPLFVNSWASYLQQSLTSTGTSFCSGGGNITSTKVYNGDYDNVVLLYNVSDLSTPFAIDAQGNFANLPAGTYLTKLRISPWCDVPYYIDGNTITLTDSSTGPKISSSVGVICEDSSGNPLSTGSAYLTLAGVAPYLVQYRIQGSGSAFTGISTSNNNLVIDNLLANTIYEVILTDGCGGSYPSTVQIKTMGSLITENTAQPCNGSPYTLAMKFYSGANYEWLDPAGNVISNTRNYNFPSFSIANNGTYTARITWSTCVTRHVKITLNSILCGNPIGNPCFKVASTNLGDPTKVGITSFGRAGAENSNWPMVRNGGHVAIESSNKGFVITRTAHNLIQNPIIGMLIYCTVDNCIELYNSSGWKCLNTQDCPK